MITRDEALVLMGKIEFIEQVLEHPHHITGPDRKQALQGAKDVFHYFATLPIWPQKKDGDEERSGLGGSLALPEKGTNATPET